MSLQTVEGHLIGWPSWNWQDNVGQGCGVRMRRDYDVLQRVVIHIDLKVQGRIGETGQTSLRSGKVSVLYVT